MKTVLTLKTSSMFFIGSVNLYKGIPTQVESEDLTPSTIRIVNQAINSGRIESTAGLLEAAVKESKEEKTVSEEAPLVDIVEEVKPQVESSSDEEAPKEDAKDETTEVEAEVKAPVKKKTTTAKKKAD